jgi:hypothetical protein
MRGRFLEASFNGQSESWLDRAPAQLTAWWLVERWEALRLALGAHGALPCEVGSPPASRVPRKHPGASHRSIPSRFARDWQTSDALRRENEKPWLFEI